MKNHWFNLLKKLDYKEGERIIDIGGAYDPVPIADVVVDICNLGRGGKSYTLLDMCSQYLPFPDKSFDIAICSQTLEDLCSPTLILSEMQRVAKRGIIESPHRGVESTKHFYNHLKEDGSLEEIWHFGVGHHKWLIETIDDYITFVPKIQYMLMIHPIPKWTGPGGIEYIWNTDIKAKIMYDIEEEPISENYRKFKRDNKQYWE